MTIQKLASVIAKREGKKSQVKIGDIREILKILVELQAKETRALSLDDPHTALISHKAPSFIISALGWLKLQPKAKKKTKKKASKK